MRHTPGPWIDRDNDTLTRPRVIVAKDGGAIVAEAYWDRAIMDDSDEPEANARLIAAAPELLEALKLIIKGFDADIFVRNIAKDHESYWAMKFLPYAAALGHAALGHAIQVIAKAEGRS